MRHGPGVLTNAELLAIMLRTGNKGRPALTLGEHLLERFGNLRSLLAAAPNELIAVHGVGLAKSSQIAAISELARRAIAEELTDGSPLNNPERVKQYCRSVLGHRRIEHCIALYLNTHLQLIACVELARGTLAEAVVYPREVVRAALEHHAAAVILAHNHPSGATQPSQADLRFTAKIKAALALVDIRLIDHLIVAGHNTLSLAEKGQL